MAEGAPLRRWSALSEAERRALRDAYQAELAAAPPTCALDGKIARMNRFLEPRGVTLTEEDLRRPPARG